MSQIIMPTIIASHPLDSLNVLGHIRVGDVSLKINLISEVRSHQSSDVRVTMGSGIQYKFEGDDAKNFLTQINEIATALIQQMSSQIQTVPPGTRIRQL